MHDSRSDLAQYPWREHGLFDTSTDPAPKELFGVWVCQAVHVHARDIGPNPTGACLSQIEEPELDGLVETREASTLACSQLTARGDVG